MQDWRIACFIEANIQSRALLSFTVHIIPTYLFKLVGEGGVCVRICLKAHIYTYIPYVNQMRGWFLMWKHMYICVSKKPLFFLLYINSRQGGVEIKLIIFVEMEIFHVFPVCHPYRTTISVLVS